MAATTSARLLQQQYYHAVLPRDVPGCEDENLYLVESQLLQRLIVAVKELKLHIPLEHQSHIDTVRLALTTCQALNVEGTVDKDLLLKEMRQLEGNQMLMLHITEQNAALVIYNRPSQNDPSVVFEAFETSATSEKVLASEGPLQWDFPGQAASISHDIFANKSFQESVTTFLQHASLEPIKKFAAVSYKAQAPIPEVRDTTDPALVCGLFMAIVEANGEPYCTNFLRKRVRDTVCFDKAHKPWRRSGFYLLLRVSVQRQLYRLLGPEVGRLYYKVLICMFLMRLMNAAVFSLSPEAVHNLSKKIGRRLAKLELDQKRGSRATKGIFSKLFHMLHPVFDKSLSNTVGTLKDHWEKYRARTRRLIHPLPYNANSSDLTLRLLQCGPALERAMSPLYYEARTKILSPADLLGRYKSPNNMKPFSMAMQKYLPLYKYEETAILRDAFPTHEGSCTAKAYKISDYITKVKDAYSDYPEFKSRQLLNLMELWVAMDEDAVASYGLLKAYHPGFTADMLDILHLSSMNDMNRLHKVQIYIAARCRGVAVNKTIFATPNEDTFASCYYDASPVDSDLKQLRSRINAEAASARDAKEQEWKQKDQAYKELREAMGRLSCEYDYVIKDGKLTKVHKSLCQLHALKRQASRIKIQIFEYPLPGSEPASKSAIFEVLCPKAFAAYRRATWVLLSKFAYSKHEQVEKIYLLESCPGVRDHMNYNEFDITLGSPTKSHLESHYDTVKFPAQFHEVCRPFGLKLDYYDQSGEMWTRSAQSPSFEHHFPLKLPSSSPYASFATMSTGWPSSNRTIANQVNCPVDLNVHEYMAWQTLLLGTYSRWPSLLRELGSTNLNFSTESTWALVSKLILQVGPASSNDSLRDVHTVFRESAFCDRLLEQIEYRLETSRRNWREPVQMDLLISILLKIISLSTDRKVRGAAINHLHTARDITRGWYTRLQSGFEEKSDGHLTFATWASVLCKRTLYSDFEVEAEMSSDCIKCFVSASIALQNSLLGDFESLAHNLRNRLLQDLASAYKFRRYLRSWIMHDKKAFLLALKDIWPFPPECVATVKLLDSEKQRYWACVTLSSVANSIEHQILYHLLDGTLLIDGQPVGSLPPEYQTHPIIQQLFGKNDLQTFPSSLRGMSLVVNRRMPKDHKVHLGFRDNKPVIRAQQRGSILELMHPGEFGRKDQWDLPAPLIDNCYHWLDVTTGIMEIRQDDPWKSKPGNWRLNVLTRMATRNTGSVLIDPWSELANRVSQIFFKFENRKYITIYQPRNGNLRVEIKRLELNFFVNQRGLLNCPQLGAVTVESRNQDIGTWYGLQSKLVLQSSKNRSQISVLVPVGEMKYQRDGQHVSIEIDNEGKYIRFSINRVIGRVDCPAEPVLLFYRVLLHAYTSHFLPDPLTGRTGVEEALCYLQSGAYMPWGPLPEPAIKLLQLVADLSPRRVYYPASLRCMETIHWNSKLTVMIQDDRYRNLVEAILQKNKELSRFSNQSSSQYAVHFSRNAHLELRALSRTYDHTPICDVHQARDRRVLTEARMNVASITRRLCEWSSDISTSRHISSLLQEFQVIGGYGHTFTSFQLSEMLDIDLAVSWGSIATTAFESSKIDMYGLMFLFSPMVFRSDAPMDLVSFLLSYAVINDLKQITLPGPPVFSRFTPNEAPDVQALAGMIKESRVAFVDDGHAPRGQLALRRLEHEKKSLEYCEILAASVCSQWPRSSPDLDRVVIVDGLYLDRESALVTISPEYTRLASNFELTRHLEEVELIIHRQRPTGPVLGGLMPQDDLGHHELYPSPPKGGYNPSLRDLLRTLTLAVSESHERPFPVSVRNDVTNLGPSSTGLPRGGQSKVKDTSPTSSQPDSITELRQIVSEYKQSSSIVQNRYGTELEQSIDALCNQGATFQNTAEPLNHTQMFQELLNAQRMVDLACKRISDGLLNSESCARWLQHAGTWPRVTPVTLLTELCSTNAIRIGKIAKDLIVELGLAITTYQRLLRIDDASRRGRQQQMLDELANTGHSNWFPQEYPNWLILEIESDIMIRPEQVEVALATIAPQSGQNSVVQLLMGKGKTSCILPMVALALAEGDLFRIIVPKPLLHQSAQIMQTKLGGILNREILHVPFSRKTPTNTSLMKTYCELHSHIKNHRGVILALPEHILSFKLSGLQRLCDGRHEEASIMIRAQDWLNKHSRDVLDECDVSLAIRTQLIYPSGSQVAVDGHPLRWQTIQGLLRLVASYLNEIARRFPQSIEVVRRPGFPLVYFLRKDAEDYLIALIVDAICDGLTSVLPCIEMAIPCRQAVKAFISNPHVGSKEMRLVLEIFKEQRHLMDVVYHLRGLIVHRILISTLKKRWNVQYGLHPMRDPIAVPYQAKGVPSPTAEWGHPDVAITLTCLSFYYEGLRLKQFKQAFEQLMKCDEPSVEFEKWVSNKVPEALRVFNAINAEDLHQLRELHERVRHNVYVLDFYLNHFVFPRHAKQFATKLQASGWDLVLFDPKLKSNRRTTGFSGTNDSRHQLPMMIQQSDLPQLAHTNAQVLTYLLEPRNRRYVCMVNRQGIRLSEEDLLKRLLNPHDLPLPQKKHQIRILIDAGAQILEYDNRQLVKAWLRIDHEALAAIFFDSDHRARVMYRKGLEIPLAGSPFAENMEGCLVYIDESHCRGTDLKLPSDARAALTLGPHLTKDALVQAAMRLRLLGQSQSVTFFSPPEVHQSILDLRALHDSRSRQNEVNSPDVLHWLLEQTCNAIEHLEPLFFNQGITYSRHLQAKIDNSYYLEDRDSRDRYLGAIRSKELQTLKQLYEPRSLKRLQAINPHSFDPGLRSFVASLVERKKHFQDRGFAIQSTALEEVEQEREVEVEIESVREVQTPVHFTALRFPGLHPNTVRFVSTGRLTGDDGYQPMFYALQKTALGQKHGGTITAATEASSLFVTTQFNRTVKLNEANDNFLRSCHWVLWSCRTEVGLLVSPEEANLLIPLIRGSDSDTHLITYAAPITRRMLHFNNLDYYAVPPLPIDFKIPIWFKIQLGIFSGRLYFDWEEYSPMLEYLGVGSHDAEAPNYGRFSKKPLTFLHEWLSVRRKGQDFEQTPMGFITTGKPLSEDHSFFAVLDKSRGPDAVPDYAAQRDEEDGDSDDDDEQEKEHLFKEDEDGGDDDEADFDAEEYDEEAEEENTFFDGEEYVEKREEVDHE